MASSIWGFLQNLVQPAPPQKNFAPYSDEDGTYYPVTPSDVYHAAWVLQHFLPWELVTHTIDLAEYWVRLGVEDDIPGRIDQERSPSTRVQLPVETLNSSQRNPVRKLYISIWGHDQGWCSNRDGGSWTWYTLQLRNSADHDQEPPVQQPERPVDVAEESKGKKALPQHREVEDEDSAHALFTHRLASNLQGNSTMQHHRFIWYPEDAKEEPRQGECPAELFRQIGPATLLLVRAHAKFPGWVNHVVSVKMEAFISMVH